MSAHRDPAALFVDTRFVDSTDDVRLAVFEEGNPDGPAVVLVHGWPDTHVLWDGVAAQLGDDFRIIRYDSRGAGQSSGPKSAKAYTMAHFAEDFAAVVDALAPGETVHVLAHDWGSTSVWEYLLRPEARDRVASFTSVSGPALDHLLRYFRDALVRPYRPGMFAGAVDQALRLTYMAVFSVPLLTPIAMRLFLAAAIRRLAIAPHVGSDRVRHADSFAADAANGLKVYRANFFPSIRRGRYDHHVDVPVQLIVNTRDRWVRPHSYRYTARWVQRLWRRDLQAGHWSPMSHPQFLARAVRQLANHVDGAPADRELLRADVHRHRESFGDTLVSVTGAGSGIGRETALAFAAEGAEVVVSDIDAASAKDTAARVAALGGVAHAYVLDVADAAAVERFAEEVTAAHGVPDIVVNNAGIGQAGRFLDTPAEEWERVLDVNLGGVVNCCRAFAPRLVDRGAGGHIVNVSSMAAYAPLQSLNAYCTSKAAVYMFSDCLRAELAEAGVGLTTIFPGVIDTNIVHTTRFAAPQDKTTQVAGRRAQLERAFQLRRYGPDKVAKAIVSAVRKDRALRPVAPEAHLLYGLSRVAPQVLRSTARGRVL
ncbi:SDR family oxidoreductase [Mycobacterium sp. NPDC050551]|uniref:SDR family oxidoreductase n=1 Tax=Mycobacterium sp. NPDC050551 TaxID=3155407 RepID=UPI003440E46A